MKARGSAEVTEVTETDLARDQRMFADGDVSSAERGSALVQPLLLLIGVVTLVVLLWQSFGLRSDITARLDAQVEQMESLVQKIEVLQERNGEQITELQEDFGARFEAFKGVVDSRITRMREQSDTAQAAVESLGSDVAEMAARQDQLNTVTLALQRSLAEIADRLERYAPGPSPSNFQFWRTQPRGENALIVMTAYGTEDVAAAEIARLVLALRGREATTESRDRGPAPMQARLALPGEYLPVLKSLSARGDGPASLVIAYTYGLGGAQESAAGEAISYLGAALAQIRLTTFDVPALQHAAATEAEEMVADSLLRPVLGDDGRVTASLLSVDMSLLRKWFLGGPVADGAGRTRSLLGGSAADSEGGVPLAVLSFGGDVSNGAGASARSGFSPMQASAIAATVREQVRYQSGLAEEALGLAARLLPEKGSWVRMLRQKVHDLRRSASAELGENNNGLSLFCASILAQADDRGAAVGRALRARCSSAQQTLGALPAPRRLFRSARDVEVGLRDLAAQMDAIAPAGRDGFGLAVGARGPT